MNRKQRTIHNKRNILYFLKKHLKAEIFLFIILLILLPGIFIKEDGWLYSLLLGFFISILISFLN